MYIEYPYEEVVGDKIISDNLNKNMNGIGKLNWTNIKSALVYGILGAIGGAVAYTITVGDLFAVHGHALINSAYFAGVGVIGSLIKNFLTTDDGKILGITKVAEPTV